MKAVNQVCSFEQAEQLKALGVNQLSLFYWINDAPPAVIFCPKHIDNPDTFSAYTSADLSMMLPENCEFRRVNPERVINDVDFKTAFLGSHDDGDGACRNIIGPSEAIVKTDLLLYLIDKGYLSIEEINDRLKEADAL